MTAKVHWRGQKRYNYKRAECGVDSQNLSVNPAEVTCLACEKRIEVDMESVDEYVDRLAPAKARQIARSKAVTTLIETHAAEFAALLDEFTVEFMDSARADIRREAERERAYESEWREKRRAELVAELEGL